MWRNLAKLNNLTSKTPLGLLSIETSLMQQLRSTYILKRRHQPPLHSKNARPKKLRHKHYIYDLVEDTENTVQSTIDVVLTSFVDGLGDVGDKVNVKYIAAYTKLLVPGLAVYATPENIEKYKTFKSDNVVKFSSKNVPYIMRQLTHLNLGIIMNKDVPWTIQPWHVKVHFRRAGYEVPEECISLPPNREIKGPNLEWENKDFYVTVTINNTEKVNVICKLHHWSTDITKRLPYRPEFWKELAPIFQEDTEVINEIISKRIKKKRISEAN